MKRPHWLRHILSLTCGECRDRGFMAGWAMRRDIELRQRNLPASPDDLDRWLRRVIAESERPAA